MTPTISGVAPAPTPLAAAMAAEATAPAAAPATAQDASIAAKFASLLTVLGRRAAPATRLGTAPVELPTTPTESVPAEDAAASADAPRESRAEPTSETRGEMNAELAAIRDFVLAVTQPAPMAMGAAEPVRADAASAEPRSPAAAPSTVPSAAVGTATAVAASPEVMIAPDAEIELPATTSAADLRPVRDLALLHPRLRIRVERVIARMSREHGHDVQVIETLRSQARQEHLHAQGRTRPGEIVTWTTQSKHTEGLAADLMVDGGWSDPVAYERLQRIAREEGLSTLGSRDPGHVELKLSAPERAATRTMADAAGPRGQLPPELRAAISGTGFARPRGVSFRAARDAMAREVMAREPMRFTAHATDGTTPTAITPTAHATEASAPTAPAPTAGVPALTAPEASIARVATVAQVATVAAVARPADVAPAMSARPAVTGEASDDRAATEAPLGDASPAQTPVPANDGFALPLRAESRTAPMATAASAAATPLSASDRAERAEKIEQIQDARASRPLQSLTLRVADADGTDHRIRVDLRGGAVAADIALADASRVSPLLSRMPELAQRLGEHGYEAGALQVRALSTDGGSAGAQADARNFADDRPHQSGQQHHHSQSRHRGRRDPGGDAQ